MSESEDTKHPLLGVVRLTRKLFTKHIVYDLKIKGFEEVQQWQQRNKQFTAAATRGLFIPENVELIERKDESFARFKFGCALFLLDDERLNRRKYQIPFREEELWFILFSLVECSKDLTSVGGSAGQISPSTVLLDEYGNVKVFSEQSLPNYSVVMQAIKRHSYCRAPEEGSTSSRPTNRSKSQSFEIAITMLEIALLDSCESIFRVRPHIDQKELSEALTKVRFQYSHFLYQMLETMSEEDANQRPSTGEVWAILYPYSEMIKAVEPFRVNRALSTQSLTNYLGGVEIQRRTNTF